MARSSINSSIPLLFAGLTLQRKVSRMSTTPEPTTDQIREFVIAGHGNLEKVKQMLAIHPELLNIANVWRPGDTETALQGAAHVGNREIAEYLLSLGAPMDICCAAMLGR